MRLQRMVLLACLMLLPCGVLIAAGISVDPSYIKVDNVELKGVTRLTKPQGYLLRLNNSEKADIVYEIQVLSAKDAALKPKSGYEELPDLKWFVFRSTEIAVKPGETGYLKYMELKAPKGEYSGKKWQVFVKVSRKDAAFVQAEAILPFWIETKVKKSEKKASGEK